MEQTVFTYGAFTLSYIQATIVSGGLFFLLLLIWIMSLRAKLNKVRGTSVLEQKRAEYTEAALADLVRSQGEMTGRMQTMAEVFGSRQSDLMRVVNDRLDGLGKTLGASVLETHRQTHASLTGLQERMALLDKANKTMGELAGQVTDLQMVLNDKQTRGAFGQGRMEAIIDDALPPTSFSFQSSLSNRSRPDCLIHMPTGAPPLVVDAKFPLEAFAAIKDAETKQDLKEAAARFRKDISKHLEDIAGKYLLPGETQDTALMFVPSESLFAEIHEGFPDLTQKAHRLRVVIVSPSLLVLAVQVIQSVLRDARMREQAHLIQAEVGKLLLDVGRLTERVSKLQTHFAQTNKDLDQIMISGDKIGNRARKIDEMQLGGKATDHVSSAASQAPQTTHLAEDELPSPFQFDRR
ncbi:DNA recombination protein RmuC [Pseudovibrio ascidiaceicola]|uniref:DNA recombination protein RmuC homolog n=1 Tax=Pseudovibrio ascidiaceicola TaxID=285279 RepID=A0A1I3YUF4_9HYPH|nr:DNA recombination protein RmuC [Pseudovibrio ascidiaceicola]SFK35468.1 DNA recombination protein RmuC [Pseudovibrio ascidiaceicola]